MSDRVGCGRADYIVCSWYCNHRDLHSFPTRRSSDLDTRVQLRVWCTSRRYGIGRRAPAGLHWERDMRRSAYLLVAAVGLTIRSEEHTSELQSRLHLVCRLLLEKKKKEQYQYY